MRHACLLCVGVMHATFCLRCMLGGITGFVALVPARNTDGELGSYDSGEVGQRRSLADRT